MKILGNVKLASILIACSLGLFAQAQTLGPGPSILEMDGANNAVDTPTNGDNDQSRQNLDDTFTATVAAGEYVGASFSFVAGQTGSVIPYIAKATGDDLYEILAVGNQVDVDDAGLDVATTVAFGGASFTLDAETELFGGIVNPVGAGSQNPVYTNLASGSTVDHDNNADGNISQGIVGGSVDGFGHANLSRSYAFSIDVQKVPEPSSILATILLSSVAIMTLRRRRR